MNVVQHLKTEMKQHDFRLNHRVRIIVGISIMLIIAAIHGFRIGQYLNGELYTYYYSFASDLILPIGSYFLLSMNEIKIRFLRKWYVKAIIVFAAMTFSEIMQAFEVYFFGVTFDLLDILMFGIGTLFAIIMDKLVLESHLLYWKYSK